MKTKVIVMGLLATVFAGSVVAQENDDMYFNKKDRAKLTAKRNTETAYSSNYSAMSKTVDKMYKDDEVLNPTDSYSARNVNPEYVSRSNSQLAKEDNGDYFVNNYQYNNAANLNQWNNNFNNWYNNPWYNTSYFGPSMYSSYNSWNRPYGGYYYDSWSNPYMSPYYQNGFGMSYYNGSSWGYNCLNGGYGYPYYGYGYGSGFGYGYGSYYSGWGSSFGMGWGWNYWNSPTVIVINNGGEYRGPVYGKRGTRGNSVVSSPSNGTRTRTDNNVVSGGRGRDTGGRVSTSSTRQDDYYNRSWRNSAQSYPTRSTSNDNGYSNTRSSSWGNSGNNTRSTWSQPSTSPSRSSSFESGGGTRSHSSSGGSSSSGSGGRTRGRD